MEHRMAIEWTTRREDSRGPWLAMAGLGARESTATTAPPSEVSGYFAAVN